MIIVVTRAKRTHREDLPGDTVPAVGEENRDDLCGSHRQLLRAAHAAIWGSPAGGVTASIAPTRRIVPAGTLCMAIRHPQWWIASTLALRAGAAHRPAALTQRRRPLRSARDALRTPNSLRCCGGVASR